MSTKSEIKFEMTGQWKQLVSAFSPKEFKSKLQRPLHRANVKSSIAITREIRQKIKSGRYEPNAPLTILIKGSSKALVDSGEMWKAVNHKVIDAGTSFIGILRSVQSSSGQPLANIAEFLHEGGSIKVTQKMRDLFQLLYDVSIGRVSSSVLSGRAAEMYEAAGGEIIYPLGQATNIIRVKGRPFISSVFEDLKIKTMVQKNWEDAVQAALNGK